MKRHQAISVFNLYISPLWWRQSQTWIPWHTWFYLCFFIPHFSACIIFWRKSFDTYQQHFLHSLMFWFLLSFTIFKMETSIRLPQMVCDRCDAPICYRPPKWHKDPPKMVCRCKCWVYKVDARTGDTISYKERDDPMALAVLSSYLFL